MSEVAMAKKIFTVAFGFTSPPVASMPITSEPESAEVMKKMPERMMAPTTSIMPAGSCSSTWKSAVFESMAPSAPTTEVYPAGRVVSRKIAVPPRMPNQTTPTMVGTSSTPAMNSRTVRPREMRAMKMPTNGVQDIHQPQ